MTTLYDLYSDKQPQTRCPNCRTDAHEIGQEPEQPRKWIPADECQPNIGVYVAILWEFDAKPGYRYPGVSRRLPDELLKTQDEDFGKHVVCWCNLPPWSHFQKEKTP